MPQRRIGPSATASRNLLEASEAGLSGNHHAH
jgi:hypothetical protein